MTEFLFFGWNVPLSVGGFFLSKASERVSKEAIFDCLQSNAHISKGLF